MARPARHQIELSAEERSELEGVARAEKKPWREVQRARIVLYAAAGLADAQIARSFDWTFTCADLDSVLARIANHHESSMQLAA